MDLKRHFIMNYQFDHIFIKAKILLLVLNNFEKFKKEFTDDWLKKQGEATKNALKAEIVYSQYHAIETLFALIFAFKEDPENPWNWLQKYDFKILNQKVGKIAKEGIKTIDPNKSVNEIIKETFFCGIHNNYLNKKEVKGSIPFIKKFLQRIAKDFGDKKIYNAYKHGLRVIRGELSMKEINEKLKTEKQLYKDKALVFLKNQKTIEIRPVEYKQAYKIIKIVSRLMALLIKVRQIPYLAKKKNKKSITLPSFHRNKIEEIFSESYRMEVDLIKFPQKSD